MRILALALVAAFLYNIFGYYVVFHVNREKARSEMRIQLAEARKKTLELALFEPENDPAFRRVHAGEFMYKGQMFDIRSEVRKGKVTVFQCYRDVKEELLMAALRKTSKSKDSRQLLHHLISLAMPVAGEAQAGPLPEPFGFPPLVVRLCHHTETPGPPPPEIV